MSSALYIYKNLQRGLCPVAKLSVEPSTIKVEASELTVQRVLAGVLTRRAVVSQWKGNELVQHEPTSPEERAVACLKRYLPRPYFASRDVPDGFTPRYSSTVEVSRAS